MLTPTLPLYAFDGAGGDDPGDPNPDRRGEEEIDEKKLPVLWLTGTEGLHRFLLVGRSVTLGRHPSCDVSIGHRLIAPTHIALVPTSDGVDATLLGGATVVVHGERHAAAFTLAYGSWFHFNADTRVSITRNAKEEPPGLPHGEPWPGGS